MAPLPFPADWVAEDPVTGEVWLANPSWMPAPPDGTEEFEALRLAIEALDMACPHGNWSRGSTNLDRAAEFCAHLHATDPSGYPTLLMVLEGKEAVTPPLLAAQGIMELAAFEALPSQGLAPAVVRVDTGDVLLDPFPPGRREEVLFSLFPSDGKYVVLDGDVLELRRYFYTRERHRFRSRDVWLRKRHVEVLDRGQDLFDPWHMRVELRPNLPYVTLVRNMKSLFEASVAFGNPVVW